MKSIIVVSLTLLTLSVHFSSGIKLNSDYICEIIQKLTKVYPIDTLAVFWNDFFEDDFSNFSDLFQQITEKIFLPQMYFDQFSTEELRFVANKDFSLSIILPRLGSLDVLKSAASRLNSMHTSKILIVFRDLIILEDLKYLLNWLWQENFFEVLVIFQDRHTKEYQIFTIDPYPSINWLNRTELVKSGNLFLQKSKDLKQYRIEVPFTEDVPRVFFYTRNGKRQLVGRNANIITLFAARMNLNLICKYQPDLDLKSVLNQVPSDKFELNLHSYSMFYLDGFGSSYPLDMVYFCVMIPFHRGVPKSQYFVIAFDVGIWLVTAFSVFFVAVLMRFIDPRPTFNEDDAGMRYFFRSLALIIYSPNVSERMTSPNIRQFVFFAQVFLLAFILSCFYSTYLTSFCTEKLFQPPIETVEDLARENLRIMVVDFEFEIVRKYATFGEQFLKLLYPVPYFEAIRMRNSFDSSYAYSLQHDRWYYLDKQQRGLSHPVFRLSKICFGPHYLVFPLRENSYLQTFLFEFILRVQSAGLDHYWEEEAFRLAVAMKHSKVLVEHDVFVQPLGLEYFLYVFVGWFVGICVSSMFFLDEMLRRKKKSVIVRT